MTGDEETGIREQDKELAGRLTTGSDDSPELLQLAAIYGALPEDRRQQWFSRLGLEGIAPALLTRIVARARSIIRFPDRHGSERLRAEHESEEHQLAVRATHRRRRWSDVRTP
jgi:hypothetical protein